MKNFVIAVMVAIFTMTVGVSTVEAKRMGGGGSFGKQSQSFSRSSPSQSQSASQAKPATPQQGTPAKPSSPWKGILGGALLGLGLGALLSHLGIGGALASMISTILMIALIGLAIMFIVRMVRNRSGHAAKSGMQPAYAAPASSGHVPEIGSGINAHQRAAMPSAPVSSASDTYAPATVPADFDTEGFLRHAKLNFIRLQAAWDRADVNDIREFTAPELFAEMKMQLQERGASPNHTDVVSIDAEMLGIETIGDEYLASVKFHGTIKEAENTPAEPFAEIWNLAKPVSGNGGWLLAGIQQVS
jgi:predicted lipid-binding transport protein (Tim44 family)